MQYRREGRPTVTADALQTVIQLSSRVALWLLIGMEYLKLDMKSLSKLLDGANIHGALESTGLGAAGAGTES